MKGVWRIKYSVWFDGFFVFCISTIDSDRWSHAHSHTVITPRPEPHLFYGPVLLGTYTHGRSQTGYRKVVNIHNVQCNRRMTVKRLERLINLHHKSEVAPSGDCVQLFKVNLVGGINNGGLAPSRYLYI